MSDGASRDAHPMLTARLLGRVEIAIGDRVVEHRAWSPRGGRALLLLLLATPGHQLARDRILDLLWPDLAPGAARNAYYKAVHSLRHTLEPDLPPRHTGAFVRTTSEWISLIPNNYSVDVDVFEALIAEADACSPDARKAALRSAVAQYGGGLLHDEPAIGWATELRERFHRTWQHATLQLAELEMSSGESLLAMRRLDDVLSAEPTNERAHRLLIRAYDISGQRDLAYRQYERCVAALREEFGVDPSEETRRLGQRLLDPELTGPGYQHQHQLPGITMPAPPTRLIGRDREVEDLLDLLRADDVRLLTLIGPGGVGKTRLAIELGHLSGAEYPDGVCFVSLAAIRDATQVVPTIARALGVREERSDSPLAQVCAVLRNSTALLILDNVEQVISFAPDVAEILTACPCVTILVTSRAPLHLRAERLFDVPPLKVPERVDEVPSSPSLRALERMAAVMLFAERAAAVSPRFTLTAENTADVARICARLDGLPLAIELAAARSRELTPRQLLSRLQNRLATLTDGFRDLPPRQQTMRDTIAWSHDLLDADLQMLLRRTAVFPGGCAVDAASRLTATDRGIVEAWLQGLVETSLVRWCDTAAEPRVDMLETTREFGLERLEQAGEVAKAHDNLVAYAVSITATAADHLSGPEQGRWLDRLDEEHDNLRAALAWTTQHGDADRAITLAGNLWRYWWSRGYLTEGRRWLERALALAGQTDPTRRGLALNGAASLAESQGDFTRSSQLHEEALRLWRTLGSSSGEARALSGLGTAAAHRGDHATAFGYHERALAIAREIGDLSGAARTLDRLGTVARHQGDTERAAARYTESLELFRSAGDLVNSSIVLSNLGEVRHQQGQRERAAALFEEALRLERELDLPDGVAFDLTNLARVRLELGELERAAALSGQGIRLFREMGNQLGLASALAVFGMVARARADPERALDFLRESLRILVELDERSAMPEHIEQLAAAQLDAGEPERAVRLLGMAGALRERIASPPSPDDARQIEEILLTAQTALGEQAASRALAEGYALPLRDALAEALAAHGAVTTI